MSECQQILRAQGKPYPRTCRVCQLGPCVHGHMTAPSDPRDAELAALKAEMERLRHNESEYERLREKDERRINELCAENASLRAERDAALAEGAVIGRMNAMKDAEAQIGRLREALRWYADWKGLQALGDDSGARAQAALEPKP